MNLIAKYIILFILLGISHAYAYPIFYKCDGVGGMEDKILTNELVLPVSDFIKNQENMNEALNLLCNGSKECFKDFEKILNLSKYSTEAASRLVQKLSRVFAIEKSKHAEGQALARELDIAYFDELKSYTNYSRDLLYCSRIKKLLDPENFKHADKIITYYPYHTNYMKITGCYSRNTKVCALPLSLAEVKSGIERAIIMGADPYANIAIQLMEGSTAQDTKQSLNWDTFIHPKFWMDRAMGCHKNTRSKAIVDKDLTSRVEQLIQHKGFSTIKSAASFFCQNPTTGAGSYSAVKLGGQCCLELGFEITNGSGGAKMDNNGVTTAMMFNFIKDMTTDDLPAVKMRNIHNPDDPAAKIQMYNGYSELMGGNEPLHAWRAGVNHYKNPAYGYQTMDYIVNSLITNPLISSLVKNAEASLGVKSKSVICHQKDKGVYTIDSDHYFLKHKNTSRMEELVPYFSKKWGDWPGRYKQVLLTELGDRQVKRKLGSSSLVKQITNIDTTSMKSQVDTLAKARVVADRNPKLMNELIKNYSQNIYLTRKTRSQASDFSWNKFSKKEIERMSQKIINSK